MRWSDLFKKATAAILGAVLLVSLLAGCMAANGLSEDYAGEETASVEDTVSDMDGVLAPETTPDGEDITAAPVYTPPALIGGGGVHPGYILGNGAGGVEPDQELTLAQAAVMLYRILAAPGPERAAFSDVSPNAWYADAIGYLAAIDVLDASAWNIEPNRAVTRGEFFAMITYLLAGRAFEAPDITFPDVPAEHRYAREIAYAVSRGWIRGDDHGNIMPDKTLTRAEAVTVINRLIGAEPDRAYMKNLFFSPFSDLFATHWAYYDIMEAAVAHTHASAEGGPWTAADVESLKKPEGFYFTGLDYYYIGADGMPLRNAFQGGLYFGADGLYTSGDAVIDGYVKEALSGIITPSMTPMEKLRAAYVYTRDSFTYLRRHYYEMGDTSWAVQEATTMFSTKRGNCYCFSAVFYFLARQLGFDAMLISGKVNNRNPVPHAWVEIAENGEMIMYDAELEMAERKKGHMQYNFFHMAYDETPWRYWR